MGKIKKVVRKFVPKSLKYNAYYYFGNNYSKKFSEINKPKVFIMLAGDYGNLGDIAITQAQEEFIKRTLPEHQIVPVYLNDTFKMIKTIKKIIRPVDIISIIGGGNMGDLYEGFENLRRNIISSFPNNKIISFPQTIDFSISKNGKRSFEKTIKLYSRHSNLHLFARESTSYNIMKESFPKSFVSLVPDIVLSLNINKKKKSKRDGIVLCLRDDSEAQLNSDTKEKLISLVMNKYNNVSFQDTHIGKNGDSIKPLNEVFHNLLGEFSNSELVITDRLHGMIFCVITGTPCIVLPNSNHKITGTYNDWLKDADYISLITEINDFNSFLKNVDIMKSIDTNKLEIPNLNKYYESLEKSLKL
ncbi:polysaccharide pyruvyl transferase family protein [Peribacillus frigoritolerans]|uniref:polysaccharide pyruvyl transferase family protein n=1 Tax=Peribacillus frigoritolerans TaxID=450367 RepID=UPI0035172615